MNTLSTQKILENTESFHEYLMDSLKDPEYAATYLKVAIEEYEQDGNLEFFTMALRNIAEAQGGLGKLAKNANLSRQNLYHTLSSKGNPSLKKFFAILKGLGLQFSVSPIKTQHA